MKQKQVGCRRFGRWQVSVWKFRMGILVAEFYDCISGEPRFTGASYDVETLLGIDGYAEPISEIAALSLNASVPEWTVSWKDLQPLSDWLSDLYADLKLGRL